jgi:pilus assembly protein CpaB
LFQSSEVLVLTKDVKVGDILDSNVAKPEPMLIRNVTPNTVKPANLNLVLGHRFSIAMKAGDPILLTSLQGMGDSADLADKIPAGKRLFTLTIADTAAARGFIKPNDHVDVMAHLSLPNRGMTTFLVLQDITLVSVGSSTVLDHQGRSSGSDVSFYVDAKDIEMLSFAQKRGEFSLSLRNPMDSTKKPQNKGVDLNDFLDHDSIANASGGGELAVTSNGKSLEKK